ncbi:3-hydroxyisobutyrate dehydrogenase [Catalinimonas alkaloidigena]|uniref:3-hydroxyisobutyrate dehydrogenase n=1 Tax=Catalinimonas alkaloidigena TaxID=1075417 RepID=A0A1G9RGW3_9BACT|nr:NAD(P)-dependent oxidoreductase [Catalinimonas alkaloidigena]SDM21675.1 3-hydroxyisobutyrate dehydrogenase [Catalinimonas alkaloidigena]
MKIGFIGLGSMGLPMAQNLLNAGYPLRVYNRTRAKAETLATDQVTVADSPADVAAQVDVLITMLSRDEALEEVLFAESQGAYDALPQGAVHLSMSTISPDLSRRLAEKHAAKGQQYVAAPVFGRPDVAEKAALKLAVAGPKAVAERLSPIFDAVGAAWDYVGEEAWQANLVKIAGNFVIASMMETLGEAFALVGKAGVDPKQFLEIVNGRVMQSPVYQTYGNQMLEERFQPAGFATDLGLKDMTLVQRAAQQWQVPMPFGSVLRDQMATLVNRYGKGYDWSALAKLAHDQAQPHHES